MCWTEEVENHLNRVECLERNFHEEGVPLAHGAVPQTWKLKSLEFTALVALRADESGILVNILEEIEALTFLVQQTAYDIDRIEVSGVCKSCTCKHVGSIDLNALKHLERC
jgi:hypothetical protein